MVARVLNTIEVPESNTAASYSVRLGKIAENWQIGGKISYIVTDNAPNIVKAVRDFLQWKHLLCFAHTLNLVYKDSIKETTEVHCLFAKCRDLVSLFHRSSKATGVLQLQCNLLFTESCKSRYPYSLELDFINDK